MGHIGFLTLVLAIFCHALTGCLRLRSGGSEAIGEKTLEPIGDPVVEYDTAGRVASISWKYRRPSGPGPSETLGPSRAGPPQGRILDSQNHLEMLAHLDDFLGDESRYSGPPQPDSLRERRHAEKALLGHPLFTVLGRMSALSYNLNDHKTFYSSRSVLEGPYQFELRIDVDGVVLGTRVVFTKTLHSPDGKLHTLTIPIFTNEFEEHFVKEFDRHGKPDIQYFVGRLEGEFSNFKPPWL